MRAGTSIGNKHFFTISCHRQIFKNYEEPPQISKNSEFQSLFFNIKNQWNLSEFFSVKNIRIGDQLYLMVFFENLDF